MICNSLIELNTRTKSCAKEPETIKWLIKNIQNKSVFYDIGANVGSYSFVAAKQNKNAKIFSFEPSYSTFCSLSENIILNILEKQITPVLIAITNENSLDYFHYQSIEPGSASNSFGEKLNYLNKPYVPTFSHMIPSMSLDRICDFIPSPNLIKIDVDGIENKIVEGGAKLLFSGKVKSLLIELVNGTDKRSKSVLKNMKKYGYKIESIHLYKGQSKTSNYIFTRK